MTAIGPTSSYNTRVVALQLLQGKPDSPSSSNDKSTYIKSSVALAAKAALGASLAPQPQNKEVFAFLAGGGFSASSDDVWQSLMDVFSDHDLQKEFSDKVKEETAKALNEDHKRISVDAARQLALRDVINAHRKLFPEEEFSFSVTPSRYGDIPPPPVTIASVRTWPPRSLKERSRKSRPIMMRPPQPMKFSPIKTALSLMRWSKLSAY
ncbi:hypothetical protein RLW55_03475 [Hyphomicrobium sp. B1]|uniref:hypothetical protein n=1 Tax=Hyphomicrobium sp. B1 TaxID=3075651 RepID=UPI003C2EB234